MLSTLAISGYRSLRDLVIPLGSLTLVTGANGSGKSSLYRALRLLADVAQGRVIQSLASEGGLQSTLWAGPATIARSVRQGQFGVQGLVRSKPIRLRLGFSSADYGYAIELGLRDAEQVSMFALDPQIKYESLWTGPSIGRSNVIGERRGPSVRVRDKDFVFQQSTASLDPYDSMMSHVANPREAGELLILRERMRGWRFYDHFRTDREAPARRPQIGTYTPALAADGSDLAAALQTILENGSAEDLATTIEDAFPGSHIEISTENGQFEVLMHQRGLLRPLRTAELSDGTLRYLLLIAALLTSRPPTLMVLNEPETSLHPDLLEPLARLITLAAERSQIIVVSHAGALVEQLMCEPVCHAIRLEKSFGETTAPDLDPVKWVWPGG